MKKTLAILLCLALLLGCAAAMAETAEKTYLATVDMNGAFRLQCTLPEGYETEKIESTNATYIARFKADGNRPLLALSIAYNELYSDVQRMNDLDAEALALIEESFRKEDKVEISYTETSHGTKLMVIKEVKDTVDYMEFYSVYLGYEVEIAVVSMDDETGLTDAQIQMVIDFLSDLDFVASADDTAAFVPFATIGEAMASEGYTGIAGGDEQHYAVVVKTENAYIRLVADLDEKAEELSGATLEYVDADTLEAAFAAYNAYIKTLPIAYWEEITAQPRTREELDALAGKTLLEVEEAGYESSSSEMGENDEAIYTVSCGLYEYDLLLNETYTEYTEHDENGFIGDLTVKSADVAGLSRNAAELRYHADGTIDSENDPWAEYNRIMELITDALSGENPEEAIQALTEAMPEQAEEIRLLADLFSSMSGQDVDFSTDADDAAQTGNP